MPLPRLSDAHLFLLAVQLCSDGNVSQLPNLLHLFRHPPALDTVLRIVLTFLPESIEPNLYTSAVQEIALGQSTHATELSIDTSAISTLSQAEARKQVKKLQLLPLQLPEYADDATATSLDKFLVHRAYRIDEEVGIQTLILDLLDPFVETSEYLRDWVISTILPCVRFNYEYYQNHSASLSLEVLESLNCQSAVNTLLSNADRRENGGNVDRDLRGLVGPWIYGHSKTKRRKLMQTGIPLKSNPQPSEDTAAGWQEVNEWLLSTSVRDFRLVVEATIRWAGPKDVDLGKYGNPDIATPDSVLRTLNLKYGQAAIATLYAITTCDLPTFEGACSILSRVAALLEIEGCSALQIHSDELFPAAPDSIPQHVSRQDFLHHVLLGPSNPLTFPEHNSIAFLDSILASIRILNDFGHQITPRRAAEIILLADEPNQLFELREALGALKHSKSKRDWKVTRDQLLWLRSWACEQFSTAKSKDLEIRPGLFWRIPLIQFEKEILNSILLAKEYAIAASIYTSPLSPLNKEELEEAVISAVFISYDNASNGNKTRGGIKQAIDILDAFGPSFPKSIAFQRIRSLISATHALSFYSLTLQHGVPFQPVSIRAHQDPFALIERVLEQNAKAYTELDNLLKIGHDFIAAGLPSGLHEDDILNSNLSSLSSDQLQVISARRIISMATSSALACDDFGTAYSYITTRLAPSTSILDPKVTDSAIEDNFSWRAAYNAGRHRSAHLNSNSGTLQSRITRLSQQSELLSLALVLSPTAETLPEILAVWRRADEEMSALQSQEQQEADAWDAHGDTSNISAIPGGFGPSDAELDTLDTQRERAKRLRNSQITAHRSRRDYEEAPMGLFDVARGAARAISKNAFPLSAGTGQTGKAPSSAGPTPSSARQSMDISGDGMSIGSSTPSETDGTRVRKRDVVSNMVTGGLVSGLGWVLGAQPVNQNQK